MNESTQDVEKVVVLFLTAVEAALAGAKPELRAAVLGLYFGAGLFEAASKERREALREVFETSCSLAGVILDDT